MKKNMNVCRQDDNQAQPDQEVAAEVAATETNAAEGTDAVASASEEVQD